MMTTGASQSPSILAYIRDEEEAGFIARIARKTRASRNRERGSLRILASTPSPHFAALPTGIIWDLHAASVPALTAIVREALDSGRIVPPIFACVDLSEVGSHQLIQLARLIPCLRLSARGTDGFEDDIIDWLLMPDQPTAEQSIINRLATISIVPRVKLAIKAAVAAKRRTHALAFATAIGVPLRTIERRLRAEGRFEAWRMIGWSTALHALWQLEIRQWSLKRVAASLGFSNAGAMGTHLQRHLGDRPRALLLHNSFDSLLDEYFRRLASGTSEGTGT